MILKWSRSTLRRSWMLEYWMMKQMISSSLSNIWLISIILKLRFTMTWFRCWMMSTRSTLNWKLLTLSWKLRRQRWMLFECVYRKKWRKKRNYTLFRSNIKSTKHFNFKRLILEVNQAIWLIFVWRFEAKYE